MSIKDEFEESLKDVHGEDISKHYDLSRDAKGNYTDVFTSTLFSGFIIGNNWYAHKEQI